MDLYQELLADILAKEDVVVYFGNVELNGTELLRIKALTMLEELRAVLETGPEDDFQCLEQLMAVFEQNGVPIHNRHEW